MVLRAGFLAHCAQPGPCQHPRAHPQVSVHHASLRPEVEGVLSEYGIPADRHTSFMAALGDLGVIDTTAEGGGGGGGGVTEELEIVVRRGESGLGIDVDQDNMIGGNRGFLPTLTLILHSSPDPTPC